MATVKQCDRCDKVVNTTEWVSGRRVEAEFKEHTKAETACNPTEYELCDECAHMFVEWVLDG